ncbi:MAG TPA: UrcA family protein [Terricaulis sp.]|nr:UrcA family protein [Terricaulis sp.]
MIKHLIVAGFSAAVLFAAPALAQTGSEARAVPVSYADLDLTRTGDAQTLLNRLRYAAEASCTQVAAAQGNPRLDRAIARCTTDALDSAVAQIDRAELSRLHAAQRR